MRITALYSTRPALLDDKPKNKTLLINISIDEAALF